MKMFKIFMDCCWKCVNLEMGLLYAKYYLGDSSLLTLASLLFCERYASFEGCEEITFLIGVVYEEEKDGSFVLKLWKRRRNKTVLDKGVVKSSIRKKMSIDGC
jgi:hypothetical protein